MNETNEHAPLLDVQRLSVHFPVRGGMFGTTRRVLKAVDAVSFQIRAGETLGLVGESGCGKTTVGRSVLRLIRPTGGRVTFDGQALNDLSRRHMRHIRRSMQIVFQDPASSL